MKMFRDLYDGAIASIDGIRVFYAQRSLWKYAILPMMLMLILYVGVFWLMIACVMPWVEYKLTSFYTLPEFLSWLQIVIKFLIGTTFVIGVIIVFLMTLTTVYEIFGGLFFDSLIEKFEQKNFTQPPAVVSWGKTLWGNLDSIVYGINTVIIFVIVFFLSLFLPFFGQVILLIVMGYRCGVSYLFMSSIIHGERRKKIMKDFHSKRMVLLGFGLVTYGLFLIPFGAIIFLPGIIIGANILYNKTCNNLTKKNV